MVDAVAAVCLLLGTFFALVAGLGLHRFADVYARMHVASKPATLGLVLVLLGALLRMDAVGDGVKLALAGLLQLATVAAGSHMIGRSVYRGRSAGGGADDLTT